MITVRNLDAFTRSYIEAALWSSTGDTGEPLDGLYSADDIAETTLAAMVEDCRCFQADAAELLTQAADIRPGYDDSAAGHDFWLTRCGHGAGFWDRGLGDVGEKLTDLAGSWGSIDLYEGDDGRIYA